jgi:hypothetical protein
MPETLWIKVSQPPIQNCQYKSNPMSPMAESDRTLATLSIPGYLKAGKSPFA